MFADGADVDQPDRAPRQRRQRAVEVERNAEIAGEKVERAERQHAECLPCADDPAGGAADRAVAAADDDRVGLAVGDRRRHVLVHPLRARDDDACALPRGLERRPGAGGDLAMIEARERARGGVQHDDMATWRPRRHRLSPASAPPAAFGSLRGGAPQPRVV